MNKQLFSQLKKDYSDHESERRQIISASNAVLHDAKRVIFSLHRADQATATTSLTDIETRIINLQKKFGFSRLMEEGAYVASIEEYVEAKMLYLVVVKNKIEKINKIKLSVDSYLGGICDLTGELVRQAINSAAQGKLDKVKIIKGQIDEIMAELVNFDLTGYLRTKYDQAKNNLRKMEQINYEINLKR